MSEAAQQNQQNRSSLEWRPAESQQQATIVSGLSTTSTSIKSSPIVYSTNTSFPTTIPTTKTSSTIVPVIANITDLNSTGEGIILNDSSEEY